SRRPRMTSGRVVHQSQPPVDAMLAARGRERGTRVRARSVVVYSRERVRRIHRERRRETAGGGVLRIVMEGHGLDDLVRQAPKPEQESADGRMRAAEHGLLCRM